MRNGEKLNEKFIKNSNEIMNKVPRKVNCKEEYLNIVEKHFLKENQCLIRLTD